MPFTTAGLAAMGFPDPATPWKLTDISDLYNTNLLNVSLDRLTGRWGLIAGAPPHDVQQWLNLVRLSDAAIRSYRNASEQLASYQSHGHEGKVSGFYLAVDELEAAVGCAYRAVLATDALRAVIPRSLQEPTVAQREKLRLARNRIAHIDEKVAARRASGRLEMHFLLPTPTGVEIDGHRLSYRDLGSVLRKTHKNIEIIRAAPSR